MVGFLTSGFISSEQEPGGFTALMVRSSKFEHLSIKEKIRRIKSVFRCKEINEDTAKNFAKGSWNFPSVIKEAEVQLDTGI
jgi:hypothetical protein